MSFLLIMNQTELNKKSYWLVTGVSGGLGRAIALEAATRGHHVIGTLRRKEEIASFEALFPGRLFGVLADVGQTSMLKDWVKALEQDFGFIEVLVNSAGYGLVGAVEEISEQEARNQMEVNFFAPLMLSQLLLPKMREHQSGHIFNVSSIAGFNGIGGLALYNASKFALEGFSEGMYLEVKNMGIRVTLVEPGPFRTNWAGKGLVHAKQQLSAYAPAMETLRTRLQMGSGNQPGDPTRAAGLICDVALQAHAPLRLLLGGPAYQIAEAKLQRLQSEWNEWREKGLATDYPVS